MRREPLKISELRRGMSVMYSDNYLDLLHREEYAKLEKRVGTVDNLTVDAGVLWVIWHGEASNLTRVHADNLSRKLDHEEETDG